MYVKAQIARVSAAADKCTCSSGMGGVIIVAA
jgi:hypothetical protein